MVDFAAAWFDLFYRTVTPVKILMIGQHLSHIYMAVLVGFAVQSDNLIVQTPIMKYIK